MQKSTSKKVVEIVKKLKKSLEARGFRINAVYLFGSYARGDELKSSDVDLVVVSDSWKNLPFLERLDVVNEIIWKEELGNVEIIPVTSEEFRRKNSVILRDASKYWIRLI